MLDVIVENIGKRERLVLRRGTQKGGKLQARNKELLLLPAPDCQDTRRENLPGVADRSVHPDKTLQVQASPHTAVGFLLRQRGDECCYAPTQSIFILKGPATKLDEFSGKFQTAFDPLPHFRKIMLQFF